MIFRENPAETIQIFAGRKISAILGNETLRLTAAELVQIIRQNAGVDWTLRKNIQVKMRVSVKRMLKKYGNLPDKKKLATENILKQAELLCRDGEFRQHFQRQYRPCKPREIFLKTVQDRK
ncbi:MAG: DUF3387 domain-containing protein [Methanosarcina sp.]|jgi:hypothetical protein|nr:DUF3387 domain-containing protein [Methanosarcina sp.]